MCYNCKIFFTVPHKQTPSISTHWLTEKLTRIQKVSGEIVYVHTLADEKTQKYTIVEYLTSHCLIRETRIFYFAKSLNASYMLLQNNPCNKQ